MIHLLFQDLVLPFMADVLLCTAMHQILCQLTPWAAPVLTCMVKNQGLLHLAQWELLQ